MFLSGLEEYPQSMSPENVSDYSPFSGDEELRAIAAASPPPKKSRRSIKKRVVAVPIGDLDGSRSRSGEACPPSDSWAWRKYGQKPIKGSPYPRGYYRCSSSKGCPARKQVERSRVDPTTLLITYAFDHNHNVHSSPTSKNRHDTAAASSPPAPTITFSPPSSPASTPPAPTITSSPPSSPTSTPPKSQQGLFTDDLEGGEPFMAAAGSAGDFMSWIISDEVTSFGATSAALFVGPSSSTTFDESDVAIFGHVGGGAAGDQSMGEEESLFADLDELPECSAVFNRGGPSVFDQRCRTAAAPFCGSTG